MTELSPAAAQLAEVLSAQTSGNNEAIAASMPKLVAMQQDSQNYCVALCELVEKGGKLRAVALTEMNRCFAGSFEKWPEDFKAEAAGRVVGILTTVSSVSDIQTVSEILVNVYKAVNEYVGIEKIIGPGATSLLTQISLVTRLLREKDLFVENVAYLPSFVPVVMQALAGTWDEVVIAMRSLSYILCLEDGAGGDMVAHVIEPLMGLVQKSLELDETRFLGFWSDMNDVLAVIKLPEVGMVQLLQVAQRLMENNTIGPFAKLSALQSILSATKLVPVPNHDLAVFIIFSLSMAASAQEMAGDIESPLNDICEVALARLGGESFMRVLQEWGSQSPQNMKISLLILSMTYSSLHKVIKDRWEWCEKAVDMMSKTADPDAQEYICRFLAALDGRLESEVLGAGLFLPIVVPLVVSESPALRHHAREALYSMVDHQNSPVPNLVASVWSVHDRVCHESSAYLTLVAKCLENEGENFDFQSLSNMAAFLLPLFQSGDPSVITGALSVAAVLLCYDEDVAEQLAAPTVQAIFACLADKSNSDLVCAALKCISDLHKLLRELIVSNPKHLDMIKECLEEEDNKDVLELAILASCSLMPGVPFIETAFRLIVNHIKSESIITRDMTALLRIAPFLPADNLHEAVKTICDYVKAAPGDRPEEIIDCVDCLQGMIRSAKTEVVVNETLDLAKGYATGKLDYHYQLGQRWHEFDLQNAFVGLICELISCNTEANRDFFQQAVKLSMKGSDEEMIDAALCIFSEGVAAGALREAEMQYVLAFLGTHLNDSVGDDLVHSYSYLLRELFSKDLLIDQSSALWSLLSGWFRQFSRHKSLTLANITAALWALALKTQRVDDVLVSSIAVFPPDDLSDTVPMCEMLFQMANNPTMMNRELKDAIVGAITRLLCLSRLCQERRNVDDAMRARLAAALKQLIAGDAQAQEVMAKTTGDSAGRQRRIQMLLQ